MAKRADTLKALRACVGGDGLYHTDESMAPFMRERRGMMVGRALAVVMPRTVEQVVALVMCAGKENLKLVPQGGNTSLVGGACPQDADTHVLVASGAMRTIQAIDEDNATLIAEAGCTLAQVHRAMAGSKLFFPMQLASAEHCQLGGMVASNAGGLSVARYGMMAEWVRGVEVVLADGRILNTLSLCCKDNSGYALTRLMCGSEGTLGMITKVALRLVGRPPPLTRVCFAVKTVQEAQALAGFLRQHGGDSLYACEYMAEAVIDTVVAYRGGVEGGRPRALVKGQGCLLVALSSLEVVQQAQEQGGQGGQGGQGWQGTVLADDGEGDDVWRLREQVHDAQRALGLACKHDVAVPLGRVATFVDRATEKVRALRGDAPIFVFGHLAEGNVHFNVGKPEAMTADEFFVWREKVREGVFDCVRALGGSFSAEHGVGRVNVSAFQRYKDGVAVDVMRAVRGALDVRGVFNPGVFETMEEPVSHKSR
ncbi:MAG: FAD-binding oxidoreductase [Alphaproteobacteria bacterium GM202ARS2]|nr:FAD-binding oxidoreductase [Alphaproteobacteria bacterium GM202ARS2]